MIETERFYFLNSPHTGSRTCMRVFESLGYKMVKTHGHHIPIDYIPNDKPKVAIIRSTVDWVASWYGDYHLNEPFEKWLKRYNFPFPWSEPYKLSIYESVVDHYFIYENSLEVMFKTMGYEVDKLPIIGKNKYKPDLSGYADLIYEKFEADWELYDKVLGGYKTWPREGNVIVADMASGQFNTELLKGFVKSQYCHWNEYEPTWWTVGCQEGKAFNRTDDVNNFKFCPYCGKEIKENEICT